MKYEIFNTNKIIEKKNRYLFVLDSNTIYHIVAKNTAFDIITDKNGFILYCIDETSVKTTCFKDWHVRHSAIHIIT